MKREIKLLKKCIKKGEQTPFLYNEEETLRLKTKLKQLQDWYESARIAQNNGFGQYINQPKPPKP